MGVLSGKDPRAAKRRYARSYFMSHYCERHGASTGNGYICQGILAIISVAALAANLIMVIIVRPTVFDILAMACVVLAALAWLIHAMNRTVDYALKASIFAEQVAEEVESIEGIEEYFDNKFPWVFH